MLTLLAMAACSTAPVDTDEERVVGSTWRDPVIVEIEGDDGPLLRVEWDTDFCVGGTCLEPLGDVVVYAGGKPLVYVLHPTVDGTEDLKTVVFSEPSTGAATEWAGSGVGGITTEGLVWANVNVCAFGPRWWLDDQVGYDPITISWQVSIGFGPTLDTLEFVVDESFCL